MKILLKDKVEKVLSEQAQTRNSDIDLTLWVWYTYYRELLEWQETEGTPEKPGKWLVSLTNVRALPSEDKISRIRRKFQELGKYPATDPAVIARRNKEEMIRTNINTPDWGAQLN